MATCGSKERIGSGDAAVAGSRIVQRFGANGVQADHLVPIMGVRLRTTTRSVIIRVAEI